MLHTMQIKPNHKMFSCIVTGWFQPSWLLQFFAIARIRSSLTLNQACKRIHKQLNMYCK